MLSFNNPAAPLQQGLRIRIWRKKITGPNPYIETLGFGKSKKLIKSDPDSVFLEG